jgi:NAD-dependent SIR2 family protein deacetylase
VLKTPVDLCNRVESALCIVTSPACPAIMHMPLQIRDAAKLVVFTGAGISTAAGIPDFRGPQGVWTLQRKGLPLPKLHTSFVYAKPSLTHQALLGLMQSGKLQYICSQNVDSLHLRSGTCKVLVVNMQLCMRACEVGLMTVGTTATVATVAVVPCCIRCLGDQQQMRQQSSWCACTRPRVVAQCCAVKAAFLP